MANFNNFKQVGDGLFGIEPYAGSGADSEFGGIVSSIDVSWSSDKAELKKRGNIVGKCYYNSTATLSFEVYVKNTTDTTIPRIGEVYNLTCTIPNLTIKGDNTTGNANITKCVVESVNIKVSTEAYTTFSVTASYNEGISELTTVSAG